MSFVVKCASTNSTQYACVLEADANQKCAELNRIAADKIWMSANASQVLDAIYASESGLNFVRNLCSSQLSGIATATDFSVISVATPP